MDESLINRNFLVRVFSMMEGLRPTPRIIFLLLFLDSRNARQRNHNNNITLLTVATAAHLESKDSKREEREEESWLTTC